MKNALRLERGLKIYGYKSTRLRPLLEFVTSRDMLACGERVMNVVNLDK